MSKDPFAPALRAEIEAVVARYEALARSHQEALAAAREHEVTKLRNDLAALLADRERTRAQEADARAQLKVAQERAALLDRSLADVRKQLDEARLRAETLQTEARAAVDREREESRKTHAATQAQLDEARRQLDEVRRQLDEARAEASQRLAQVEGALREVQQEAESLSEAFASERVFIEVCQSIEGTALHDALRQAFGEEFSPQPSTYAALKARRPDAILTHAFKERGRLIVAAPLTAVERAALPRLAEASGCELIEPEHGVRFASSSMDKASTQPDPAEEGNVLGCLMPGLRLAGTEGALVFPRVLVASG
jgi:predicted  nucleic acid-binding Zn-ribbon protein